MSWFQSLRSGLSKSAGKIAGGISGIFTKNTLDASTLEALEDHLILSDMGHAVASKLVEGLRRKKLGSQVTEHEVRTLLAADIAEILTPVAHSFDINTNAKPYVVLVCGVNGNGKTTSIGKMAYLFTQNGWRTMLAAGDTFRAAATAQLQIWADRTHCPLITADEGADAASLAYRAYEQAKAQQMDVLLIDTAGRLHNQNNLMQELQKIRRVLAKHTPDAPHQTILVLDGTTGQNAVQQVAAFQEMMDISGLIVTKLDGTAKGGVVLALAERFNLPIYAIGVGEGVEHLQPFDAQQFANALMDI